MRSEYQQLRLDPIAPRENLDQPLMTVSDYSRLAPFWFRDAQCSYSLILRIGKLMNCEEEERDADTLENLNPPIFVLSLSTQVEESEVFLRFLWGISLWPNSIVNGCKSTWLLGRILLLLDAIVCIPSFYFGTLIPLILLFHIWVLLPSIFCIIIILPEFPILLLKLKVEHL